MHRCNSVLAENLLRAKRVAQLAPLRVRLNDLGWATACSSGHENSCGTATYPQAKLILSGYGGGTEVSNARMMAKVALALGVSKPDIILLETAKDTWEEARQAAAFVKNKRMVLVTSASHMQRALNEFHDAGMKPIPAPTNYLAQDGIEQPWNKYMPKAIYLEQTERYWHETMGLVWQSLRDWLDNQSSETQEPIVIPEPSTLDDDASTVADASLTNNEQPAP